MAFYYAFNGDADGLCALQQLRLTHRGDARLITGVKRDIRLLDRVRAGAGDTVHVLDISLDANRDGLNALLDAGAIVHYFDHHHAGHIPETAALIAHIDPAPDVCTSILVDRYLAGRYRRWAITAAFGDNLAGVARAMAADMGLGHEKTQTLESLGLYLNYNAYGDTVDDLHFDPARLAGAMLEFGDPLEFAAHSPVFSRLAAGYEDDMMRARSVQPLRTCEGAAIIHLPAEAWARRVIGVLANDLVQRSPQCAFALLSLNAQGDYTVSVRVPSRRAIGADEFCRKFATGGGRRLAGGINHLPVDGIDRFSEQFEAHYRLT